MRLRGPDDRVQPVDRAGGGQHDEVTCATDWGIAPIPRFPYPGSALFMWDSGSPRPPLTNIPPTAGHDPHDDLSITPASQELGADFLLTGSVTDVCGGAPCVALALLGR